MLRSVKLSTSMYFYLYDRADGLAILSNFATFENENVRIRT